jgi:enoyl-CoA hydratase/carnithine racemase
MTVVLDNPPRNFIDRRMVFELDALLRSVERDSSIGAVVLTGGHPSSFITHYDVEEILGGAESTPDSPEWAVGMSLRMIDLVGRLPGGTAALMSRPLRPFTAGLVTLLRVHRAYLRMNRMNKVFVAAINGHCAAGGCELALACDVRLAADGDFMIGMTEPVLGFNPGGSGGQRLTRAVGPARSVEMMLEAHMYSPHEALEAGLVHRVVEPERLLAEAQETAARLARRSPRAIWAVKRAAYEGFSWRWRRGLHLDRSGFVWAALASRTKAAMRHMLEQIDELPPERWPSPWSHPELLREWQQGTVVDFNP